MPPWLVKAFEHRHAWLISVVLAVLAVSPWLRAPRRLDDWFHRTLIVGNPSWTEPETHWSRRLYVFFDGDPHRTQELVSQFGLPWWTLPELKIAFFRPLSALTHGLDHLLWTDAVILHNLHSTLWYAAMCGAAYLAFKPWLRVPALAVFVFAFDLGHVQALLWLASRNVLIATTFALLTLACHHRWRASGRPELGVLSSVLFAITLLSGEIGLSICAYLFAYALLMDTASRQGRVLSLSGYVAIGGAWLVAYLASGFGAFGSGFYAQPTSATFWLALPGRLGAALAVQLGGWPPWAVPTTLWGLPLWVTFGSLAACAGLLWGLWPLLRTDRHARFWMLGTVLSALPSAAIAPSGRALAIVGIGSAALLTLAWTRRFLHPLRRALLAGLAVMHLGIGPIVAVSIATVTSRAGPTPEYPDSTGRPIVLIGGTPLPLYPLLLEKRASGEPTAPFHYLLAPVRADIELERIDAQTLRFSSAPFLTNDRYGYFSAIHRDPRLALTVGDTFGVGPAQIDVEATTPRGLPRQASFTWPSSLDELRFYTVRGNRLHPIQLPQPGQTMTLSWKTP